MSDFQSLVDHTRFELVRRLVNRPGDLLFVESDELICEMAEVLTSPVNTKRRLRMPAVAVLENVPSFDSSLAG